MDRKIKIILSIADIGIGSLLVYLILFHKFTIAIDYELQQLIFASTASVAGITFLYWKRLKDYNPKLVKLLELLLYLVAPTVASVPLLAKINYYWILVVCFGVAFSWFNFGLIQIGKEEVKINTESRKTIAIMIGMLTVFLGMISWLITIICAYQCKNP